MAFVIHWHESAMDIRVFPIPITPLTSLSTRSLWVFPVHQVWALVSCIQPGLVICFTLDNIHVLMLVSWNIPPLPSPTESKSLFCTWVLYISFFFSFFFFLGHTVCYGMLLPDQTLNLCFLQWKCNLNHWTVRDVPIFLHYFTLLS